MPKTDMIELIFIGHACHTKFEVFILLQSKRIWISCVVCARVPSTVHCGGPIATSTIADAKVRDVVAAAHVVVARAAAAGPAAAACREFAPRLVEKGREGRKKEALERAVRVCVSVVRGSPREVEGGAGEG